MMHEYCSIIFVLMLIFLNTAKIIINIFILILNGSIKIISDLCETSLNILICTHVRIYAHSNATLITVVNIKVLSLSIKASTSYIVFYGEIKKILALVSWLLAKQGRLNTPHRQNRQKWTQHSCAT